MNNLDLTKPILIVYLKPDQFGIQWTMEYNKLFDGPLENFINSNECIVKNI
jgi:hypothetical protein